MKLRKLITQALIWYDKYRLSSRRLAYLMNMAYSADSATRDGQRAAVTNDVRYSENHVQVKPQVCTDFCHVSKYRHHTECGYLQVLHPVTHAAFPDMAQT